MTKLKKILYGLGLLIIVYIAVGFKVLPIVLKDQLIKNLDENLTQKTDIAKIEFNPLTFKIIIHDFKIFDSNNVTTASFKEFVVDFSLLRSIKQQNIRFKEVTLTDAFINVIQDKDGNLNLANLVKPSLKEEPKEEEQSSSNINFLVSKLTLDNANVQYSKEGEIPYSLNLKNINYTLYDLGTYKNSLTSNNLTLKLNEYTNVSIGGAFKLQPFKAYGKVSIEDLRLKEFLTYKKDMLNFDLDEKTNLNLILNYNIDTTNELALTLSTDKFELNNLNLKQNKNSLVNLEKLNIGNFIFDLQNQNVAFDDVNFKTLKANMVLDKNGINFANLINTPSTKEEKNKELKVEVTTAKPQEEVKPWTINLSNIKVNSSDFVFNDKVNNSISQSKAFNINLTNLGIIGSNIDLSGLLFENPNLSYVDNNNNLSLIAKNANINLDKLSFKENILDINSMALKTPSLNFDDIKSKMKLQTSNINLNVNSFLLDKDNISIKEIKLIKSTINMSDKTNNIELQAKDIQLDVNNLINKKDDLSINSIKLLEPNLEFLNTSDKTKILAKNLNLEIKKISNSKAEFKIEKTNLNKPNISVVLAKKDAIKKDEKPTKEEEKVVQKEQKIVENKKRTPSKTKINVGPVNITNGIFSFEDKNLPLPFKTTVTKLNGKISEFKNTKSSTTNLEVKGVVDEYGVAKITGILHPNNIKLLTDINLIFSNIAIKNFTPYSGKFVGREIKAGKLDLDLKYNIEESNLEAKNNIVITQLEFGEKVESPDAISLPLDIAISLLKDSKGVIDINLPVSGNVDDPQFAIGSILWRAFTNLITKAVTAPFSLLGAMFNFSEDEISSVKYGLLEDEVGPIQKETLDKISQILKARNEIAIELTASYDMNTEGYAQQKQNYLARKDDDRNLKPEQIEALILNEKIKIPNLEKIAKNRITNISNYLVKEKGINPKQIVMTNKIENNSSAINLNISKK
ncbi:MAG: DUF748 domain-containing protein [Aliarcobacter sp.]|nr:DUF748 domain-containing protein [Aliarcobacter sp.]